MILWERQEAEAGGAPLPHPLLPLTSPWPEAAPEYDSANRSIPGIRSNPRPTRDSVCSRPHSCCGRTSRRVSGSSSHGTNLAPKCWDHLSRLPAPSAGRSQPALPCRKIPGLQSALGTDHCSWVTPADCGGPGLRPRPITISISPISFHHHHQPSISSNTPPPLSPPARLYW